MRMKLKLLFLMLMLLGGLPMKAAGSYTISKSNALEIAKRVFDGKDVDYFYLKNVSASTLKVHTIFVDAEPMKGWPHECYVLEIDKTSSSPVGFTYPKSKVQMNYPPMQNYETLYVRNRYGDKANSVPNVKSEILTNDIKEAAERTYAVILSGGHDKLSNYERYWNDCSFIYQTLVRKYGVPKDNIFPIMSDGENPEDDVRCTAGGFKSQSLDLDFDGINETVLAATQQNVQSTLKSLENKLKKDDHLFFYVIDHGGTSDNYTNSYINLWKGEILRDYILAEMLTPFTNKFVNVNVVLGQCYSGGFNDNLTKVGCVVAAASTGSESSWACSDIPYDEFVYHWTCAVNGATHENVKVNADSDNNGRVTMKEAFDYAKANDRRKAEHPQYVSTPISVGEDLAFNNLAKSVDLYVKDNELDTGKEPNTTTDEFWKSPSIWVRNQDDGIEIHENPVYSPDHLAAIVYVKIHNRGKEDYKGGKWLHVYWAKASTAFNDKAWKGRELYNGTYVTGGHLDAVSIPEIEAGGYKIVKVTWALPPILVGATDKDKHHFCLKTKIMDIHYDEKYEAGKKYFDLRGCNDQAQKNVSIIPKDAFLSGTLVFVRNVADQTKNYTLELLPRTQADESVYEMANVELDLSPTIYKAWERGGLKSQDVVVVPSTRSNDSDTKTVRFISPNSKLQSVNLKGEEFDIVSLKFDFKDFTSQNEKYTFDLIQRDEDGNIIGGETFIVESPILLSEQLGITASPISCSETRLDVDNENVVRIKWVDEQGNYLGDSRSIDVLPVQGNNNYTVIATTENGDVLMDNISLDSYFGIKSVDLHKDSNSLKVGLNGQATDNSVILISSVLDGSVNSSKIIPNGDESVSIDVSGFSEGLYAVILTVDGVVIDQKKIKVY